MTIDPQPRHLLQQGRRPAPQRPGESRSERADPGRVVLSAVPRHRHQSRRLPPRPRRAPHGNRPQGPGVHAAQNWTIQSPQNADAQVELARLHEEYNETPLGRNGAELRPGHRPQQLAGACRARPPPRAGRRLPQALQNYQRAYAFNRFQPELERQIATLQSRVGPAPAGAPPHSRTPSPARAAPAAAPHHSGGISAHVRLRVAIRQIDALARIKTLAGRQHDG